VAEDLGEVGVSADVGELKLVAGDFTVGASGSFVFGPTQGKLR
jgi:hypothetical protein